MNRRSFLKRVPLAAGLIAAPGLLRAETRQFEGVVLRLNGYGGDYDRIMTETIAKPLAEKTGMQVIYTPGTGAAAIAKIIASPSNPPYDLIICDSPAMPDLIKAQAIEKVTAAEIPAISKIRPHVREFDDYGLPFSISSMVPTYNTDKVKQPLRAFADLGRPDLKGRVAIFNLENTGGLLQFLALADSNGGSVDNVDPAFEALKRLKPNITAITPSTVNLVQLLEQEEALAAGMWDGRVYAMRKSGKPMALVEPTEGLYALRSYVSPVKGSKHPEAVKAYLQQAISDEAVAGIANFFRYGPATDVKLDASVSSDILTYGEPGIAKIKPVDWTKVAMHRSDWLTRFNREMR